MTKDGPLPQIGAPATRALAAQGITRLADPTHHRSEDLLALADLKLLWMSRSCGGGCWWARSNASSATSPGKSTGPSLPTSS
jgi:hypothetical protein